MEQEYVILKEEKDILKHELEEAYLELDEYDLKFETYDEMEAKARSADEKDVELEKLRKSKEATEKKMEKLRREFDVYQKKYETKVRRKAFGEKFDVVKAGSLTLEDVEIRGITETGVKVRHASGFATLNSETAPIEWKRRFFLRSKEEIAEREKELELFLNPPPESADSSDGEESEIADSEVYEGRIDKEKERGEMATLQSRLEGAVVSISGNGGKGTGFFVQDGITTFLYTTADVLDGNTTLKIVDGAGREWKKFGDLEVAKELNLVRLAVSESVETALTLAPAGEEHPLGMALASFGFENGADSVTQSVGRLRKVNATSYEGTASLTKLPNGSPVVTSEGTVLAILTEPMAARKGVWKEKPSRSRVKRFAARIDIPISWEKASLGSFVGARASMERFDRVTRLLATLAALPPSAKGLSLDSEAGGVQTVKDVLQENRELNVVTKILELDRELSKKGMRTSERDLRRKYRSVYATVQSNAGEQSLGSSSFSAYHTADVEVSLQQRDAARAAMEKAIRTLGE